MTSDVLPSRINGPLGGSLHPSIPAPSFMETIGFTKKDLLWSLALWLATLGLAPFVIFYVLMVN